MITIYINNAKMEIDQQRSLADVITQLGYQHQPVAVAVNRTIIPRSQHLETFLNENDVINIVSPMQGG